MENTENNEYTQLCVWPGTLVGEDRIKDFENWLQEEFGVRGKYECEVKTLPDETESGSPIPDTGGRNDLFFYIHTEDVGKFALARMQYGIRWWEDVISYNDSSNHLYTEEFKQKYPVTW